MQTANPNAPDYDWQADREWFNQRLANARIHNSELEQKLAVALGRISNLEKVCAAWSERYAVAQKEIDRLTNQAMLDQVTIQNYEIANQADDSCINCGWPKAACEHRKCCANCHHSQSSGGDDHG